jgi:chaperonin GroES
MSVREVQQMAKKAKSNGVRIVPLGDKVVLKRHEAESKTAGGIVLPDSAKDKPQKGEVVAIGDGHVKDDGSKVPLTVREGDRVIFSSYAGDEIKIGEETYLLLRESDILATY